VQRESLFNLRVSYMPTGLQQMASMAGVEFFQHEHKDEATELSFALADEGVLSDIIAAVRRNGSRLLALEKREPTLEDAFVSIVGRKLSDEQESVAAGVLATNEG
jgi:ABC-2 type transport system ATP-binding protein